MNLQIDELMKSESVKEKVLMGFHDSQSFAFMQRVAAMFAQSALVPDIFRNNIANTTIALEMSVRMGANPLAVMQNLYIVKGKPGWSSQFIIAAINTTGKFSPLRFELSGTGDNKTCIAWVIEKSTEDRLESPPVSIAMAKAEGWWSKKDKDEKECSKWQTMPDLMLRYRAATFFGRLYVPEILMGMKTVDEIIDIEGETVEERTNKIDELNERFKNKPEKPTEPQPEQKVENPSPEPEKSSPAQSSQEKPALETPNESADEVEQLKVEIIELLKTFNNKNLALKNASMKDGKWMDANYLIKCKNIKWLKFTHNNLLDMMTIQQDAKEEERQIEV